MSRFKVGDTVYFSPVGILAQKKVVLAVKQRRFLKPLYLLANDKRHWFMHWESESKLTEIQS